MDSCRGAAQIGASTSVATTSRGNRLYRRLSAIGDQNVVLPPAKGGSRSRVGPKPRWPPERSRTTLREPSCEQTVIGPIDGSAKLTIFTEGNHYPVLLPLAFNAFPAWCHNTGVCQIDPTEILVVTLPQPMVVEIIVKGGVRLGNAVIPIGRGRRVFPDFVMAGADPLRRLAAAGIVENHATVFARHRGLAFLIRRDRTDVRDLGSFVTGVHRVILASESEPGARHQYLATLKTLIGTDATTRDSAQLVGVSARVEVSKVTENNASVGKIIEQRVRHIPVHPWPARRRRQNCSEGRTRPWDRRPGQLQERNARTFLRPAAGRE
jgi:hypothetical protein